MLASFSVKNFRSIVDLTMDLTYAEGKAPNSYRSSPTHIFFQKKKIRIVPCLAVLGANASGKTNFIKALYNLQRLLKKNIKNAYDPNLIHNFSLPISYNLSFFVGENLYSYSICYDATQIISESLEVNHEIYFTIEHGNLISYKSEWPTYTKETLNEILKVECSQNIDNNYFQIISFMSLINRKYQGLDDIINRAVNYIESLFVFFPESLPKITSLLAQTNKFSQKYARDKLLVETTKMLKKFDFDIENITFKEYIFKSPGDVMTFLMNNRITAQADYKDGGHRLRAPYAVHRTIDGKEVEFRLAEESSGTQILLQLIMMILISLEKGVPLIIDEIDRAIHPFILNCILDIYKDKSYNLKNSQLIFTTHTTDILENKNIRISEIGLIDKTKKTGTTLKRASDFEGVRNIHNFRNLYCSGKLSAIPFPYI